MKKVLGVIPARIDSTRLQGKVLLEIGDKPVIQHTYESGLKSSISKLIISTEDKCIQDAANEFDAHVFINTIKCNNGTERLLDVYREYPNYDAYINLQADEPFISHIDINNLINSLFSNNYDIMTLYDNLKEFEFTDRSIVKLMLSSNTKEVGFFTRSSIYTYPIGMNEMKKHVGIYVFKNRTMELLSKLKTPSENEIADNLEQLRWLDNNLNIGAIKAQSPVIGINTFTDYMKAIMFYKEYIQ